MKARFDQSRFSTIIRYLKCYRWLFAGGVVAVTLASALILVEPYLIKVIFDLLEANASSQEVLPWILLMFGLAFGAGIISFVTRRTIIWMSHRIEYDLRRDLWSHLLELASPFFRKTPTGDIMARMTNDLEAVRMMVGPGILHATEAVVTLLIAIPMMIYLSPLLTLYSLAPALLFPPVISKLGNMIHLRYADIQRQYSDLTSTVQENLRASRVVRAYRQEEAQIDRFNSLSAEYVQLNLNLARLYGVFFPLSMFIASCLSLCAFYFGGLEVMHGQIPLGTLVAFFVYLGILFWPMFAIGGLISMYQRGTASLDRINDFLLNASHDNAGVVPAIRKSIRGQIEFRNLCFGYNGDTVLDNLSLKIESGQSIGIVGRTGSGKSTLVSLLTRLYPVADGQIFIDDIDINAWDLRDLRRQIGFATQEVFLFSDSIRANIQMGAPDVDADDVLRAVDIAGLAPDISVFESGLDTIVGERGILLSGGQQQRTSIARAIVRDPAILILDDVTSAVDTETEAGIRGKLEQLRSGRTTIIVSNRLSAVRYADRIIFLERGRLKEVGSHDELMAANGEYAALFRSQLLSEELAKS